jgi:hypothetical protein
VRLGANLGTRPDTREWLGDFLTPASAGELGLLELLQPRLFQSLLSKVQPSHQTKRFHPEKLTSHSEPALHLSSDGCFEVREVKGPCQDQLWPEQHKSSNNAT